MSDVFIVLLSGLVGAIAGTVVGVGFVYWLDWHR